jgi:hypothetical protein
MTKCISLALLAVGLIVVGCSDDSSTSTSTSTSSFCCGLNMRYFDCPNQGELEKCVKAEGNACTSRSKACNE